MKRFVFEFTNEENDRATEEFYLLKNVETVKSDCNDAVTAGLSLHY